ncbi:MAG: CbiX/SirB N-terminal domain-containing protein, partial [Verrucomicrobiota bacterium]
MPSLDTLQESALIILGHGSTENPDSSAPTFQHADSIRDRSIFGEVHCAFWKEETSFRQLDYLTERETLYIVPNFISEGYFTRDVIPRELELAGPTTHLRGKT